MRKKFIYGNYGTKLSLETVENLDRFLVEEKKIYFTFVSGNHLVESFCSCSDVSKSSCPLCRAAGRIFLLY